MTRQYPIATGLLLDELARLELDHWSTPDGPADCEGCARARAVVVELLDLRPTIGMLAHPEVAYHDANGRLLVGPCHVSGCRGRSLPGGGDNHATHEQSRVTYYAQPTTYRGQVGWRVGSRGDGGSIAIFTPDYGRAITIRNAYRDCEAGKILAGERDRIVDTALATR